MQHVLNLQILHDRAAVMPRKRRLNSMPPIGFPRSRAGGNHEIRTGGPESKRFDLVPVEAVALENVLQKGVEVFAGDDRGQIPRDFVARFELDQRLT